MSDAIAIPTQAEVTQLRERIETLERVVDFLTKLAKVTSPGVFAVMAEASKPKG